MRSQLKQATCRWASAAARLRRVPSLRRLVRAITFSLAITALGCKQGREAGPPKPAAEAAAAAPDDVPLTEADVPVPANYAEAVERLCGYRDAIRQAVQSGNFKKAHHPLDETNIAIERLPAVARSSGIPPRDWEQIVTAAEDLGEALDKIHTQIDAGGKPDYAAQADAIDQALTRLQAITQTDANTAQPTNEP